MIRAKVNDKEQFDVLIQDQQLKINDRELALDMMEQRDGTLHFVHDGQSYKVKVIKSDLEQKAYRLEVNGHTYEVALTDDLDRLLEKMGMSGAGANKVNEVKAPMPGLVLKVTVEVGQEVKKGDSLLVLEAMKMENVIKSPGDAVVKDIKVQAQDKVEKNFVLIEFE